MKNTFFQFSKADRNGIVFLCSVIAILTCLNSWLNYRQTQNLQTLLATLQNPTPEAQKLLNDTTLQLAEIDTELTQKQVITQLNTTPHTDSLAPFNPNELNFEKAIAIGLPKKTAHIIEKYLQKGGKFRQKTDLKKIYGLTETQYQKLEPYIQIPENKQLAQKKIWQNTNLENPNIAPNDTTRTPHNFNTKYYKNKTAPFNANKKASQWYENNALAQNTDTTATNTENAPKTKQYASQFKQKKYEPKPPAIVDINTADTTQWKELDSIGSYRAKSIVKYRTALGGFYSIEQVAECYSISPSLFQKIKPQLTNNEHNTIQKININTADYPTLSRHPYIKSTLAKLIISYRNQHNAFKDTDELQKIKIITPEQFQKLKPYCTVE